MPGAAKHNYLWRVTQGVLAAELNHLGLEGTERLQLRLDHGHRRQGLLDGGQHGGAHLLRLDNTARLGDGRLNGRARPL